ncbi:MAG: NUDIX hydrolase [Anaerolineae bacterium]|nr:NUDIX hydrolase [Anaerolineae bacterium]
MRAWKTLSKKTLLEQGKWLTVESHKVQLPGGTVIDDWSWVITPDYVNVVTIMQDGRFAMFRQVKYGVEGIALAPVGGYLEPGESALEAAKRELREETGCEAEHWLELGQYRVDGNRGAGTAHLFVAQGAHRIIEPTADDLEEQELVYMSRAEIETALANGQFKVLAWTTAVALALLWMS